MQRNTMITALVVAAFALPLTANAVGDKPLIGPKPATSATNAATSAGADATFKSADKNADGFVSMEEANGTPHAATFATLDKNGDGRLSQQEHASSNSQVAAQPGAGTAPDTGIAKTTN